jgi:hypothetical protein
MFTTATISIRRLPVVLFAVIGLLLAIAGSAAAAPVQPLALNLVNWSGSAGFGSSAPGWYEDSFGIVHLQGAARQISLKPPLQRVLGTLPPAARPSRDVFTITHTFQGTYADVEIETNGTIYVIGAAGPAVEDLSFVSLEGITYQPANKLPATPIAVNGANWSPTTLYGSAVRAPAAYTDGSTIVHLEGAARQINPSGPNANYLGNVPAGDAPGYNVYTIVATNDGTYADVAISPSGGIYLIGPAAPMLKDYSFVSLEGITYTRSYQIGAGIFLNAANWTGNAGYGSRSPGWVEDNAGVIHLQGAVAQFSGSGTNANLIGTLPIVARPNRTVYTIVHTLAGTYADLAIEPNGQIWALTPRPPAVTDLRFLSLEGITYQQ